MAITATFNSGTGILSVFEDDGAAYTVTVNATQGHGRHRDPVADGDGVELPQSPDPFG